MYFTCQSIVRMGDPKKLNFEGPEMQKWKISTDTAQRVLSSYHVYSRSFGD